MLKIFNYERRYRRVDAEHNIIAADCRAAASFRSKPIWQICACRRRGLLSMVGYQATTLQNVENSPHFRPERIFKCFNQKSVCIMYKRSLVELLKGMIKSKRFSKLR